VNTPEPEEGTGGHLLDVGGVVNLDLVPSEKMNSSRSRAFGAGQ
jgi:hypothetical protein